MLKAGRCVAIEDLALEIRTWSKQHQLKMGEGIADMVTAIFVAHQQATPQAWLAEAISQAAWALVHQQRGACNQDTVALMVRNTNDILRGRA